MSKARDLANAGTALTTVSATELGYLDGVTSAVQTQINAQIPKSTVTAKGDILVATGSGTVVAQAVGADGQYLKANSALADGVEWATVTIPPSVNVYGYKFTSGAGAGPYTVTNTFNTGTWTQSGSIACKTTIGSNSSSDGISSTVFSASNASTATIDLAAGAKYTSPVVAGLTFSGTNYFPNGRMAHNGSNTFAIGLSTGFIAYSSNGVNWTVPAKVATANGGTEFQSMAYGLGAFIGVTASNYGEIYRSTNGTTWGSVLTPGNGQSMRDVTFSGSRFVVLQENGTTLTSLWSDNGTGWNGSTIATNQYGNVVQFGNGTFVTFGNGTTKSVYTSTDGATWTARTTPFSAGYEVLQLAYADKFVAIAQLSNTFFSSTSTNGITWTTPVQLPIVSSSGITPKSLVANNSATFKYIFPLNARGDLLMSTDGVNWVTRGNLNMVVNNATSTNIKYSFAGGKYIAIGDISSTLYATSSTDPAGTAPFDVYVTLTGPSTSTTTVV